MNSVLVRREEDTGTYGVEKLRRHREKTATYRPKRQVSGESPRDAHILLRLFSLRVAQLVKNLPAMQADLDSMPGLEDPLEKRKATHSSILTWRIPWTV